MLFFIFMTLSIKNKFLYIISFYTGFCNYYRISQHRHDRRPPPPWPFLYSKWHTYNADQHRNNEQQIWRPHIFPKNMKHINASTLLFTAEDINITIPASPIIPSSVTAHSYISACSIFIGAIAVSLISWYPLIPDQPCQHHRAQQPHRQLCKARYHRDISLNPYKSRIPSKISQSI